MSKGVVTRVRPLTLIIVVLSVLLSSAPTAFALTVTAAVVPLVAAAGPPNPYYSVETITLARGAQVDKVIISGPPMPPPGYDVERQPVDPAVLLQPGAGNTLAVPAYNWVFGCSAVSASMIGAYFDRSSLPNIYAGPGNGGVMPMDNSTVWGTWSDGFDTYPDNPLIASHQGVDGRTTRGSINDYWVKYGSTAQDPYISGGWTQHAWGDAFGDYMKTSQSAYENTDGSTAFYNWTSDPAPLTCAEMVANSIHTHDGTYGRKLFYEARGYTVADCYSQKTDNNGGGFTFANYKAQIDAGFPVLLNLAGHSIVGVGYLDPSTVYINDTWDHQTHQMTWGGSYSGMLLLSVSVVNPVFSTPAPTITSLSPTSAGAGGAAFTLTVNGTNFVAGSVVRWNGANRTTTYVSGTRLTAGITAADIATAGSYPVTVGNPGGGTSNAVPFTVVPPSPPDIDVTPTSLSVTLAPGQTATRALTIRNTGTGSLSFQVRDVATSVGLSPAPAIVEQRSLVPERPAVIDDAPLKEEIHEVGRGPAAEVLPAAAYPTGSWGVGAPLPSARYRVASATDNHQRYFVIGGNDESSDLSTNQMYNATANAWTTLAPMPTARMNAQAAVVNGVIYVPGGYLASNSTTVAVHEAYNIAANSWSTKAPLPQPLAGAMVASTGGKVYVFGGNDSSGSKLATSYQFDPVANSWVTRANMPLALAWGGAVEYGGRIYVATGLTTSSVPSRKFLRYDAAANTWTSGPDLNTARMSPAVILAGDYIYVISGGACGTLWDPCGSVERYDLRAFPGGAWQVVSGNIPTPVVGAAYACAANKLWVGAGSATGPSSVALNQYLDEGLSCGGGGSDAAWLTESPTSGSVAAGGSQSVTVSFNTAGLAAGTYRANVIIASNDPDENPVTVPVTMIISAAVPDIDVTPLSLSKTLAAGQTGTSTLTIRNTGQAALSWQLSENPAAAWLSESPTSGSVAAGGSQSVTVLFNTAGLAAGTYRANVIIASNDPDENPVTVPVTMVVTTAVPDIDVTPPSLSKTLAAGQTGTSTLTIRNTGQAALNWQLSENPAAAWLSESPTSGSVAAGGSQAVTVSFNTTGLAAGTHQASLIVASNDPDEPQVAVPVTLIVRPATGVRLYLAPASLSTSVGGIFTLDVMLEAGTQPVNNVELYLTFAPALLQVVTAGGSPATTIESDLTKLNTVLANEVNPTTGRIRYDAGSLATPAPTGTFRVAVIRLKALGPSATGTTAQYVAPTDVFYSGGSVLSRTEGSTITIQEGQLKGHVTLQSHATPSGHPVRGWLYPPGGTTASRTFNTTLDSAGNFLVTGLPGGAHDIRVKGKHSLSTKRPNVTVPTGSTPTDFCTVLEGDASDDDRVSGADFSILATTYNKQSGDPGFDARADFNDDGRCSGVDFSLLAMNYNRSGPVACTTVAQAETPTDGAVDLAFEPTARDAGVGQIVDFNLKVVAGSQALNNVETYVSFDPAVLQVVDAAGNPASQLEPVTTTLDNVLVNEVNNTTGRIRYDAGSLATPAPSGSFSVAVVRFEIIAPADSTLVRYISPSAVWYGGYSVLGALGEAQVRELKVVYLPLLSK